MKLLSKILAYAAVPCLAAALLISFIGRLSGDKAWIKREYEKLDINDYTGMSTDEMCAVYLRMVDYMKGGTDELQTEVTVFGERTEMFVEREISHMNDVRKLWFGVETAKYILFAFTAIAAALALYVYRRRAAAVLARCWLIGICVIAFIAAVLAVWAAVDFYSFWILFHAVFLDVPSSTFDPAESLMIRICVQQLFSDLILRIAVYTVSACAVISILAGIVCKTSGAGRGTVKTDLGMPKTNFT